MAYQLTPDPYSLDLTDGFFTKTDKSKGLHLDQCLVNQDGNAAFHSLKDLPGTFAVTARKIFEMMLKSPASCMNMNIFKRHLQNSGNRGQLIMMLNA